MNSRNTMSRSASTIYDQDDSAEEHASLATLCLRVLTIIVGLFILLPLVLFSPVVLVIYAIASHGKEAPASDTPGTQTESAYYHPGIIPAPVEELGIELIAG